MQLVQCNIFHGHVPRYSCLRIILIVVYRRTQFKNMPLHVLAIKFADRLFPLPIASAYQLHVQFVDECPVAIQTNWTNKKRGRKIENSALRLNANVRFCSMCSAMYCVVLETRHLWLVVMVVVIIVNGIVSLITIKGRKKRHDKHSTVQSTFVLFARRHLFATRLAVDMC